jgi:hypothetical protein
MRTIARQTHVVYKRSVHPHRETHIQESATRTVIQQIPYTTEVHGGHVSEQALPRIVKHYLIANTRPSPPVNVSAEPCSHSAPAIKRLSQPVISYGVIQQLIGERRMISTAVIVTVGLCLKDAFFHMVELSFVM